MPIALGHALVASGSMQDVATSMAWRMPLPQQQAKRAFLPVLWGDPVSDHKIAVADDAKARVRWRFSEAMREVMRRSDHYAELRTQIVAALESRYSVTLYELGCVPTTGGAIPSGRARWTISGPS